MRFSQIKPTIAFTTFFRIGAFVLGILLVSCENEEEQNMLFEESQSISLLFDKAEVEKAELKEKLAYKNYHLTNLMEEALRTNLDFEQQMGKKSGKLKGLRPFYFDDLLSEGIVGKGRRTNNDSIQFSLNAFIDLDGGSWHPYVYKIKEGRGNEPLFLINSYDPDMEKEIVQGYKLNTTGQLKLKYRDLSEEDIFGPNLVQEADGNDVYVLGISPEDEEAMLSEPFEEFNDGEIPEPSDENGSVPGGGGGGGNAVSEDLQIQKIKIKDKKESWIEKADVYIYGYAMSGNPNFFEPLGYFWGDRTTIDGAQIRNNPEYKLGKFSNSDVNNGTFKTINKHIVNRSESCGLFISYIIYEYDGFPAPLKSVYFGRPDGSSSKISYRSYNQKYFSGQVRGCDVFEYDNFFVLKGFGNVIENSVVEYHFSPLY
ncbi:MAG: hypothetical protein GYB37_12605 [Algicola sp.]|nr:hypothetical protein [Algicola sp.]